MKNLRLESMFFSKHLFVLISTIFLLLLAACHPKMNSSFRDYSHQYKKSQIEGNCHAYLQHIDKDSTRLHLFYDPFQLETAERVTIELHFDSQKGKIDSLSFTEIASPDGYLEKAIPLEAETFGQLRIKVKAAEGLSNPLTTALMYDKGALSLQDFYLQDQKTQQVSLGSFPVITLENNYPELMYRGEKCAADLYALPENIAYPPPPFSTSSQKAMTKLERVPVKNEDLDEGAYVFRYQQDSLERLFFFTVQDQDFPRLKKPEDLLESLRYICTKDEFKRLQYAPDPRASLDSFWVKRAGSYERGRVLISEYYGRVERANFLFTCAWPGWKTEPGMIYTIYGEADRVMRNRRFEEWIYFGFNGKHDIRFVFERSPWGSLHLRRATDYRKSWNENVYLWRNGIINNISH